MQNFVSDIENDIDTVHAVTHIFDCIGEVNRAIDGELLSDSEQHAVIDILKSWDAICGMIDWSLMTQDSIPEEILILAQERIQAKQAKNFSEADNIRSQIEAKGYKLTDSKDGIIIEKI